MRVTLFLLFAAGLSAQQNAIPPNQSKDLIQRSFANWKPQASKKQVRLTAPPASKVCSVPLTNILPNATGAIRTITPPSTTPEPNMPQLQMPAPPCK